MANVSNSLRVGFSSRQHFVANGFVFTLASSGKFPRSSACLRMITSFIIR
jgi:hypothetical protein